MFPSFFCVPSPLFCLPPSPWFPFVFYFTSSPLCSYPCSLFPSLFSSPCFPMFPSLLICCSLLLLPPLLLFFPASSPLPSCLLKDFQKIFLENASHNILRKYFSENSWQMFGTHRFECVEGSSRKIDIAGGGCGLFF